MDYISVTLQLPAEIAEQARAAGILTDANLLQIIEKELERQKAMRRFFETADQLTALQPKLSLEEIQAEIEAGRRA